MIIHTLTSSGGTTVALETPIAGMAAEQPLRCSGDISPQRRGTRSNTIQSTGKPATSECVLLSEESSACGTALH